MSSIRVAIDGYSSTGKSTLAKALANRLGFLYVDTGAMYRAVALYLIENGLTLDQLTGVLDQIKVDFDPDQQIRLNGRVVASEIRHMEVNQIVCQVAKISEVRKKLVEQQQGFTHSVVMDVRDIGTVVFPDAQLKIFMTAKPEVRAQRRFTELQVTHPEVAFEEVLENLKMRDFEDENRIVDPLKKAEDAMVLDNSDLSPEEQLNWVITQLQDRNLV
ncbi:MAG: (d)CMP kinase [Flavobacteriaceae bacterium]